MRKSGVLDVVLNLHVTLFMKKFWLVVMVRFCHLSQEEYRFSLLFVERTWSSRVVYLWLIGTGTVTSPSSAEVTIQRRDTEEERDPKVEPEGSCEQDAEENLRGGKRIRKKQGQGRQRY